jgi:phosphosulfolactate phosphohydrolase-like enzyme
MIEQSAHGKYLTEIGYADDLKICASVDSIPVVPILSGDLITLKKEQEKQSVHNSKPQTKSSVKK